MHAYVVEDFRKMSILVNLKQIPNGCTTNNLTNMIKISMKVFGGSFDHDLATKVVCFDADDVGTFQGIKIRVATQLKKTFSPFRIHVHCIACKTNPTTFTFSNLLIFVKIEALLATMYFNHFPKQIG